MSRDNEPDRMMAELFNGSSVRTKRAAGNAMCLCPCHEDASPSLAIKWTGQRLIYTCYARCPIEDIFRAVRARGYDPVTGNRLDGSRTYTEAPRTPVEDEKETLFQKHHRFDPYIDPDWITDPRAKARISNPVDPRRYVYKDLNGHPLMVVTTYRRTREDGKTRKYFIPVSPWYNTAFNRMDFPTRATPEPRLPYGAESCAHNTNIAFAAEGEKCRDALYQLLGRKFPTISTYGSAPNMADLTPIAGRTLIISRDSDAPGKHYAEILSDLHKGQSFTIEAPPDASGNRPPKWDISDWKEESPRRIRDYLAYLEQQLPADIYKDIRAHF